MRALTLIIALSLCGTVSLASAQETEIFKDSWLAQALPPSAAEPKTPDQEAPTPDKPTPKSKPEPRCAPPKKLICTSGDDRPCLPGAKNCNCKCELLCPA